MTKTLTEQWREGKLPAGEYYVKDSTGVEIDGYYPENSWERGFINHSKFEVEEVLAPVPSYKELQKMKEQIQEANECIKDKYHITCSYCSLLGSCMSCGNRYFGRYIKNWGVK